MAGEAWVLDSLDQDTTNSPFTLIDRTSGIYALDFQAPVPARDTQWVGSADTEGESVGGFKYKNRELALKVMVTEPPGLAAATNLVIDPSAEAALTWLTYGGSAVARTALVGGAGDYVVSATSNGSAQSMGARATVAIIAVTSSTTYAVGFSSQAATVPRAMQLLVDWFTSGGAYISTSSALGADNTTTGFTRATAAFTSPSNAAQAHVYATVNRAGSNIPNGEVHYFDAVSFVQASAATAYFDGDTPGCSWTGTHHASTSTRPASGGPLRDAILSQLEQKMAKINREGGTLKRTLPGSGFVLVFDLLDAEADPSFGNSYISNLRSEVELKFVAKPFWRGTPIQLSDHAETTNPELIFTETGILGDVPGLGILVLDEDQGADQQLLIWGVQCANYSSSANAALVYTAIGRTALGTSTTAANASGFGASTNVVRNTDLIPSYQAIMSTQATGAGAHLSHVGTFRVFARLFRPTGNTGAVSVRLSWSEGDFRRFTSNASVDYAADEREGAMTIADLGLVYLNKVKQGAQQWQGRVEAKSTVVGDELDVNRLWLFPVEESYGEVRGLLQFESPTAFSARDEFDQSAGALTGKTAPVGGVWAGAGDADDFTVETAGHTAQRTAVSDINTTALGRFAVSGVGAFAAQAVQITARASVYNDSGWQGVIARYVDANNWIIGVITDIGSMAPGTLGGFRVLKKVAGSETNVWAGAAFQVPLVPYTLRLSIDAAGRWNLWAGPSTNTILPLIRSGQDNVLATGGALASGKPGFFDSRTAGAAVTRNYDNFLAFVPTPDAAVFASQSAQLRYDSVIREDSAGNLWTPESQHEGDYLTVPAAGREGRTVRIIVKGSRFDPDTGSDPNVDDLSGRLTYTPRGLAVPAA